MDFESIIKAKNQESLTLEHFVFFFVKTLNTVYTPFRCFLYRDEASS